MKHFRDSTRSYRFKKKKLTILSCLVTVQELKNSKRSSSRFLAQENQINWNAIYTQMSSWLKAAQYTLLCDVIKFHKVHFHLNLQMKSIISWKKRLQLTQLTRKILRSAPKRRQANHNCQNYKMTWSLLILNSQSRSQKHVQKRP